jgi:hypothetical protein
MTNEYPISMGNIVAEPAPEVPTATQRKDALRAELIKCSSLKNPERSAEINRIMAELESLNPHATFKPSQEQKDKTPEEMVKRFLRPRSVVLREDK